MFIDADINYEADSIFRLMSFGGDDAKKGVVAGIPRTRSTTVKFIGTPEVADDGTLIMNGRGLVKAKHVATAFMWIRREVVQKLVDGNPQWDYYDERSERHLNATFDFELKPHMFDHGTDQAYYGEDYNFCDRVSELGYEIWIDPSITLGHLGVQEYMGNYGQDWLAPRIQSLTEVDQDET
tara:strand:+ start:10188 stop:10730 length:543 start_codon:yes stop_codon:yes gene_type:complete